MILKCFGHTLHLRASTKNIDSNIIDHVQNDIWREKWKHRSHKLIQYSRLEITVAEIHVWHTYPLLIQSDSWNTWLHQVHIQEDNL